MSNGLSDFRLPFEAPIFAMEDKLAELEARHARRRAVGEPIETDLGEQIRRVRRELNSLKRTIYSNLEPWQSVTVARHPNRPQTRDYIELIFDQFVELHGDRTFGDDKAIVTGLGHVGDQKVMLVGHQKGRSLAERLATNYGLAHPEGYRKALSKMKLAAKFGLPIVSLIDTPGAAPGIAAEERGQATVIAESILAMSRIDTPIVCVIIGEGGSGGALAVGVGDRVAMLEHAYYSVISPEGCATILWKSNEKAPQAAAALKMTSKDLLRMGVIDDIVAEPLGGAHRNHREAAAALKSYIVRSLREIAETPRDELLERRYQKFRNIGVIGQASSAPAIDPA